MKIRLFDGPMDGAVYALDNERPSTNRKPDGLWFDRIDDKGRHVRDEYVDAGTIEGQLLGVDLKFVYDGETVQTEIEFDTTRRAEDEER